MVLGVVDGTQKVTIDDELKARIIIETLTFDERKRLQHALNEINKPFSRDASAELSREQIRQLFLINALPFIGFGFLDNAVMVVAGEYIDQKIGAWLTISTMAAAALGNTVSDVAGVGLAHYVEFFVSKCGIKHPVLNSQQLESSLARAIIHVGRGIGLILGCLVGMFPLLFFHPSSSKTNSDSLVTKET
ncbi:unnamed protein product [Thelazia callipaeda]|uniref:Transmembrane protein 65 n=1 Tax=Thelazia callipaeda TaxID=103827 RepID=A0A158RCV7_THECL|nr:unnamed protein product [Thelazia callipaeda]